MYKLKGLVAVSAIDLCRGVAKLVKAPDFDSGIRRFDSFHPCQNSRSPERARVFGSLCGARVFRPDEKGLCSLTVECLRSGASVSPFTGLIATRTLRISRRDMKNGHRASVF